MSHSDESCQRNKEVVRRFNEEVIGRGNQEVFRTLMDPEFVNRTAMPGIDPGIEGMHHVFERILRPALPDLHVEIHDQIAEGDKVTTRKTLHGTHRGEWMGIAPTHQAVAIHVIDIVRLRDGRYLEHWGANDIAAVVARLRGG